MSAVPNDYRYYLSGAVTKIKRYEFNSMTVWIHGHGVPDLTASMFESDQRPREPTWINANSGLLLCEKLNCALHSRHMKAGLLD